VLEHSVSSIHGEPGGKLWLGSLSGLVEFDVVSKTYRVHPHKYEVNRYGWGRVTAIQRDEKGLLWLATAAGLLTFDRKTEKFNYFTNDPENPGSISFNIVTSLETDRSGLMWIGTAGMGINIFNPLFDQFHKYAGAPIPNSRTTGFSVYSMLEENDSTVWVACEVLYRWNKKSGELKSYERSSKELLQFGNTPVWAMAKDTAGFIWFASTEGLFVTGPMVCPRKEWRML
jgi:ligand-binding sensor domain-containing protein